MTRIAILGDVHLDLTSDGLSRLEEQERILDWTIEKVEELKVDVFVQLGDLFDRPRPSPEAYAVALRWASRISRAVGVYSFVISGNHDKSTRGTNALEPIRVLSGQLTPFVEVFALPTYWEVDDLILAFLPFVTPHEAKGDPRAFLESWVESMFRETSKRVIAFTHLEVVGAETAVDRVQRDVGATIPDVLIQSDRVERIFAGHVHRYQELGKVTVVGSALYVDFGEATDPKGLVVAEV